MSRSRSIWSRCRRIAGVERGGGGREVCICGNVRRARAGIVFCGGHCLEATVVAGGTAVDGGIVTNITGAISVAASRARYAPYRASWRTRVQASAVSRVRVWSRIGIVG